MKIFEVLFVASIVLATSLADEYKDDNDRRSFLSELFDGNRHEETEISDSENLIEDEKEGLRSDLPVESSDESLETPTYENTFKFSDLLPYSEEDEDVKSENEPSKLEQETDSESDGFKTSEETSTVKDDAESEKGYPFSSESVYNSVKDDLNDVIDQSDDESSKTHSLIHKLKPIKGHKPYLHGIIKPHHTFKPYFVKPIPNKIHFKPYEGIPQYQNLYPNYNNKPILCDTYSLDNASPDGHVTHVVIKPTYVYQPDEVPQPISYLNPHKYKPSIGAVYPDHDQGSGFGTIFKPQHGIHKPHLISKPHHDFKPWFLNHGGEHFHHAKPSGHPIFDLVRGSVGNLASGALGFPFGIVGPFVSGLARPHVSNAIYHLTGGALAKDEGFGRTFTPQTENQMVPLADTGFDNSNSEINFPYNMPYQVNLY